MKYPPRLAPIDWIEAIWNTSIDAESKLIACCLRRYMNAKNDMAWPSVSRIAGECGLSERTVQRRLSTLCDEGWIAKTGQSQHRTTVYQANLPPSVCQGVTQSPPSHSHPEGVTQSPELNKELNNNPPLTPPRGKKGKSKTSRRTTLQEDLTDTSWAN